MVLVDLTPEQKAKVIACKSTEELLALAREEGCELSDDDNETVPGGLSRSCGDHV